MYKTIDGGSTWTNISGALPNIPANCVTHENKPHNPIYVGTDAGVYYMKDGMSHFIPFKHHFPNVIVNHLQIHYGAKEIRAATYGRGLWECNLGP